MSDVSPIEDKELLLVDFQENTAALWQHAPASR